MSASYRVVCAGVRGLPMLTWVGAALAPRWVRRMTSGIRRLLSAHPRLARVDLPSDACATACSWRTLRNADPSHFAFEAEYGASVGRVGDFAFHRSWSPRILSVSVVRQLWSGPLTTKTLAARRLVCGEMESPAVVARRPRGLRRVQAPGSTRADGCQGCAALCAGLWSAQRGSASCDVALSPSWSFPMVDVFAYVLQTSRVYLQCRDQPDRGSEYLEPGCCLPWGLGGRGLLILSTRFT
jgi:hypothetical protein